MVGRKGDRQGDVYIYPALVVLERVMASFACLRHGVAVYVPIVCKEHEEAFLEGQSLSSVSTAYKLQEGTIAVKGHATPQVVH